MTSGSGGFERAGVLADAYAGIDWSTSAVGAPETWSPTLRQALDLVWQTRYPAALQWGPQLVLLYNEAYVRLIGDKHPSALGTPAQEVFPEAWDVIGPVLHGVRAGSGASYFEDQLVPLVRAGFIEDCYFTYSNSAVRGADGQVEGIINVASETTSQVISRRRLELLSRLQSLLGAVDDHDDVAAVLGDIGRAGHPDLPVIEYRPSTASTAPADATAVPRLPYAPPQPVTGDGPLVHQADGVTVVWSPLGIWADGQDGPVLVVALNERLAPSTEYLDFVRLIAAAVGQALNRLELLEVERRAARTDRHLSEALQRSLLTAPEQRDPLRVAVRYRPAAETAQIGGDWYDSFVVRDGGFTLTIGDVSGHDLDAAASMAQLRNMLRGIAYALEEPPAAVMTEFDKAIEGLLPGTTATAVLARVDQDADQEPSGRRTMSWTNAGHAPPVLVAPDGGVRLLTTPPDTMLGVSAGTRRRDHELVLEPGSSVVFYTDGLVERRTMTLQAGLDWLVRTLHGCEQLDPEKLADHVMANVPPPVEDDVALMVLHVGG